MLYQSSLERKTFVKLKKTQLLSLVIKLTKPFAVAKACTRWKTKRGMGIIFFRADNYAVVEEILVNKYCTQKNMIPIPLLVFHLVQPLAQRKASLT